MARATEATIEVFAVHAGITLCVRSLVQNRPRAICCRLATLDGTGPPQSWNPRRLLGSICNRRKFGHARCFKCSAQICLVGGNPFQARDAIRIPGSHGNQLGGLDRACVSSIHGSHGTTTLTTMRIFVCIAFKRRTSLCGGNGDLWCGHDRYCRAVVPKDDDPVPRQRGGSTLQTTHRQLQ